MATEISLEPTTVNLTVYKGDSINLRFNLTEDGTAYSIPALGGGAGWQGNIENPTGTIIASTGTNSGTFVLTGAAASTFLTATVPSTATSLFVVGTTYSYDIQYTWIESAVTYIRTFVKGSITVLDEVTS
jgi:hypothetical protein